MRDKVTSSTAVPLAPTTQRIFTGRPLPERHPRNTDERRYDDLFVRAALDAGVQWLWLKAQAIAESNLDPLAESPAGAQGIAQFMPATWHEWGTGSPFNPGDAIPAQARYLKYLLDYFYGDYPLAFAAYNWGMGRVRRHVRLYGGLNRRRLPTETRDYLERIERIHARLVIQIHETHRPKEVPMPETTATTSPNDSTPPPAKRVFESKTVWINALAGVLTLGLNLLGVPIPGEVILTTVASTVVNIGLRLVTKQPVTF